VGTRYPRAISGGQQQRVALARALVVEPRVLLLDEPLSNLDALLREEMRVELKRLQERLGTTMVFVTHDQAEALTLSDRVVVMDHGRIEQVGRPDEVYRHPATGFVARFLGRANFLAGLVVERDGRGIVVQLDGGGAVAARSDGAIGERVQIALRQESIRLVAGARIDTGSPATVNECAATVVFHAFAGQAHHYVVQVDDGRELAVVAPGAEPPVARGTTVTVAWGAEDVVVLRAAGS
jgi:putative spermidine/putrescine transport system ATP-binding protein